MIKLLIFLGLLGFLSFKIGWIEITPKAHNDFKAIKEFFSSLTADSDYQDKTKEVIKVKKNIEEKNQQDGKIRHQITVVDRFWMSIKDIYNGFFEKTLKPQKF